MANTQGTRWRGKLPIPEHTHPLIRQFFSLLNRQMTTVTEVAVRCGFRRCTISNWRYCREPRLSDFNAALNAVGYELCIRSLREDQ